MTRESRRDARLQRLSKMIASSILDDWRGQFWIRETVLRTVVELERTRSHGVVRSFLDAVECRRMRIYVGVDGEVNVPEELAKHADLNAVFIAYRREIVEFLQHVRQVENMPWRDRGNQNVNASGTETPSARP